MFHFKQAVYDAQEQMTVSGIDQLAVSTASRPRGSRLRTFSPAICARRASRASIKDLEEGYRLGVNSTPTYFVDGTEITWLDDKVMEDYLRTLFPKLKTIDYAPEVGAWAGGQVRDE